MTQPPRNNAVTSGRVAANFLSLFIPLFITFTLFVYSANEIHKRLERQEFNDRLSQFMGVQQLALASRFQNLVSDLRFLSQYHVLQERLEHKQAQSPNAEWEFLAFSQSKPIYEQVRLLDLTGMEVMRVNNVLGQARTARPEELRSAADRYFFQEALKLAEGEIYISPMELSQVQGQLVTPLQPTVRLASPLFSTGNQRLGVILLNVKADEILFDLRARSLGMGGHMMLLDAEGYYLAGMNPDHEWGNSIPERAEFRLGLQDPSAWKVIAQQKEGTLDSPQGTYTFITLDLNQVLQVPGQRLPVWKVVHHILAEDLIPEYAKLRGYLIFGFIVTSLLLALGAYAHSRERHHRMAASLDLESYKNQLEAMVALKTQELLSSQAHYRAVVETALDGIVILADNQIQFVNRPFLDLCGYPLSEVLDKPKDAFFAPLKSQYATQPAELLQVSDGVLWHASGLEIPIEFHAQRFEFQQRNGELFFIRDARFRKAQEETIRMLSRAVEQSPVSVVITDPEGKIIYINPKFELVTGYSLADAKGSTPRILKSGHQEPQVYEDLWNTITQGREWQGELLNRNKMGTLYWEKVSISPILDAAGRIVHFLGIKEDITAAKWQAAELKKAKEDAEASTKAKAEFLATMSHEIRTPMNGLIGMSNLLQETELTLEQQQYVKTLKVSGENLLRIINDILDFSKIEAGKLHLEHQPLVLRQAIEESLDIFSMPAAEKELELFYQLEPGLPEVVVGDIIRIKQILINLLGNAVKFTSHGQIKITVEQGPPGSGLELRFCVADTGIGIEAGQLERLFKAFSQADSSTTRKYGGTGLGLTISKRLAEIMDGNMWAESHLGDGSSFFFTLNLGKSKGELIPQPLVLVQPLKGLLVSANPDFVSYVQTLSLGWQVEYRCLSDYEAAKAALALEPFAFALLDQGAQAFATETWNPGLQIRLRERLQQEHIPCILAQFVNEHNDAEARKDLAFIPLFKPIKRETLFQALCRILGKSPESETHRQMLDHHLAEKMPLRILLAEDNAINQLLAVKMLKKMGYDPLIANDGQEVVTQLAQGPVDLVLMDIQMPNLDGVAATKVIRETLPPEMQPVIIAMTANAMAEDREKYLAAGMDDYLPKPIQPHLLQVFLKNWGEGGRSKRDAGQTEFPLLDLELLKSRAGLGSGFMHRFVEAFREQAEKTLPAIENALNNHDFAAIQNQGHVLKGIAANTGAIELCDLGKKIQFKGEDGNEQGLAELVIQLQPTLSRTLAALDEYLASLPPEAG